MMRQVFHPCWLVVVVCLFMADHVAATMIVSPGDGACCRCDGSCEVVAAVDCDEPGSVFTPGVSCDDVSCAATGACCIEAPPPIGGCFEVTEACCDAMGGTYSGDGTTCADVPCGACCLCDGTCSDVISYDECLAQFGSAFPGLTCADVESIGLCEPGDNGACCLPDGSGCVDVDECECDALDGILLVGASCDTIGACCLPDGSCIETTRCDCRTLVGTFEGGGSTCDAVECVPTGACCVDITVEMCTQLSQAGCDLFEGFYFGDGTTCADPAVTCLGACCLCDGTCELTLEADCTGFFQGRGTTCDEVDCGEVGVCCRPIGCVIIVEACCQSPDAVFLGPGATCEDCTGSCCFCDGSCVIMLEDDCIEARGSFLGNDPCDSFECSLGACCMPDGSCQFVTASCCFDSAGTFLGEGELCNPGDVTGDQMVDLADLLAVIGNWGGGGPDGDANDDGAVDLADLLLVIGNWGSGGACD